MSNIHGDGLIQRLAVFDVDGTLIKGQTQRLLIWYLALNGKLPWPIFIRALWWFAKYRLRLIENADEVRNEVLRVFAGMHASEMEILMEDFYAAAVHPIFLCWSYPICFKLSADMVFNRIGRVTQWVERNLSKSR